MSKAGEGLPTRTREKAQASRCEDQHHLSGQLAAGVNTGSHVKTEHGLHSRLMFKTVVCLTKCMAAGQVSCPLLKFFSPNLFLSKEDVQLQQQCFFYNNSTAMGTIISKQKDFTSSAS